MKGCMNPERCFIENDYTGTYSAHLYCEQRDLRMKIQAISAPGLIIGFFVFSILSDTRGRRFALVNSFWLMSFGLVLLFFGIMTKTVWVILFGQFVCGVSSSVGRNIGYTIAS